MTEPDITELYERLENHLYEQDYDKAIDLFTNLEDDLQAFIPFLILVGHAYASRYKEQSHDLSDLRDAVSAYKRVYELYQDEYPVVAKQDPEMASSYRQEGLLAKYNLFKTLVDLWNQEVENQVWEEAVSLAKYAVMNLTVEDVDDPELQGILVDQGIPIKETKRNDEEAFLKIGELLLRTHQQVNEPQFIEQGTRYLKRAHRSEDEFVKGMAALYLGLHHEYLDEDQETLSYLLQAKESGDEYVSSMATANLAYRHVINGEVEYAIQLMNEAKPANDYSIIQLQNLVKAIAYYSHDELDRGLQFLEQIKVAITRRPDAVLVRDLAQYYLMLAALSDDSEVLESAIQLASEFPNDVQLQRLLGVIQLNQLAYESARDSITCVWKAERVLKDLGLLFFLETVLKDYPGLASLMEDIEGVEGEQIFRHYCDLFEAIRNQKWERALNTLQILENEHDPYWYGLMVDNTLFGASFYSPPVMYFNRALFIKVVRGLIQLASGQPALAKHTFDRIRAQYADEVVSTWGLAQLLKHEGKDAEANYLLDQVDDKIVLLRKRALAVKQTTERNQALIRMIQSGELSILHKDLEYGIFPSRKAAGQHKEYLSVPIDQFHTIEFELAKNPTRSTKVLFRLLGQAAETEQIELSQMEASILLFLCMETSADGSDWLSMPEERQVKNALYRVDDLLQLPVSFRTEAEADDEPDLSKTWIWDFENKRRKRLISSIHDAVRHADVQEDEDGYPLIVSHDSPNDSRHGKYSLHPQIRDLLPTSILRKPRP